MEALPISEPVAWIRDPAEKTVRRLIEITSRQQQTQHTLLHWLWAESGIEKPSKKFFALSELDSGTWVDGVRHKEICRALASSALRSFNLSVCQRPASGQMAARASRHPPRTVEPTRQTNRSIVHVVKGAAR